MNEHYFEQREEAERRHNDRSMIFAALRERRPRRERHLIQMLFWLIGGW